MADKYATNVLITLVVITAVMFMLFLFTIMLFILRWKKDKAEREFKDRYSYASVQAKRVSQSARASSHYDYAFPNTFTYLAPDESTDSQGSKGDSEDHIQHLEVPQRISTISGHSVDIGDIGGVSEFVLNPSVVPAPLKITYGEYKKRKADSMRSSAGVDLGGDYHKAWKIVGRDQTFDL